MFRFCILSLYFLLCCYGTVYPTAEQSSQWVSKKSGVQKNLIWTFAEFKCTRREKQLQPLNTREQTRALQTFIVQQKNKIKVWLVNRISSHASRYQHCPLWSPWATAGRNRQECRLVMSQRGSQWREIRSYSSSPVLHFLSSHQIFFSQCLSNIETVSSNQLPAGRRLCLHTLWHRVWS